MSEILRFAPSPTGPLHLGHAFSAFFTWREAEKHRGRALLRIEDLDPQRCKPEFEAAIRRDLAWLGLDWPQPVRRQSDHLAAYGAALAKLKDQGLVYPCFCSRKEVLAELTDMFGAPHLAPQSPCGPLYPGTCRGLSESERQDRIAAGEDHGWRIESARAEQRFGKLVWQDLDAGDITATPSILGDALIARRDVPSSYHLAVVVDDAAQQVTLVTRGEDLRPATHLHRLLQAALGLPVPRYRFHRLLTDDAGKRLSKRDGALSLAEMREAGETPAAIRTRLGF